MCAYLKALLGRPHKTLFIINVQDFFTIHLVISVQNVLLILSMVITDEVYWPQQLAKGQEVTHWIIMW